MPLKVTKNFYLTEFLPKSVYAERGDSGYNLMDSRVYSLMQVIRDYYKRSITINNWFDGGDRDESGYRLSNTSTGAKWSQHKFGRACDFIVDGISSEQVRKDLRDNFETFKQFGLTAIEKDTPTWVHVSVEASRTPNVLIELPYK